jgi:hypothetical protein
MNALEILLVLSLATNVSLAIAYRKNRHMAAEYKDLFYNSLRALAMAANLLKEAIDTDAERQQPKNKNGQAESANASDSAFCEDPSCKSA